MGIMNRQQAMRDFFLALACLCVWMGPARAETPDSVISARDLYTMCVSTYDTDAGYCVGYVSAVANRMATGAVEGYGPCAFGAARSQQFATLFTSYAQNYPDSLHAPAESIIAAALGRAFSCQKS